jgi:hypothetical protein
MRALFDPGDGLMQVGQHMCDDERAVDPTGPVVLWHRRPV